MKKKFSIPVYGLFLALCLCSGVVLAATPELRGIRYSRLAPDSEEVVLQLSGAGPPKESVLAGKPPKIILDFPGMRQNINVANVTQTQGDIVQRIRVGVHTQGGIKTRVVFDLTSLKGIKHSFQFDEKSQTLTVRFTGPRAGEKTPVAHQAKPSGAEAAGARTGQAAAGKQNAPEQAVSATPAQAMRASSTSEEAKEVKDPESAPVPAEAQESAKAVPGRRSPFTPVNAELAPPADNSGPAVEAGKTATVSADKAQATAPVSSQVKEPEKTAAQKAATVTTAPEEKAKPAAAKSERSAIASAAGAKTAIPFLTSVEFNGTDPKGEMVIFKLNGFYPPQVQGMEEGTPRVICDFDDTTLGDGVKSPIRAKGKYVKIIRISRYKNPDRIRVVIDLAPGKSYDLQQVFFKEDNVFVLIVNESRK